MAYQRKLSVVVGALSLVTLIPVPAYAEPITWGSCADFPGAPTGAAIECTRVPVPRDYAEPRGPKITIAVSRIRATDPARRRGAILTNPGGPGADGTFAWVGVWQGYPELAKQFDLIGFAPRGTTNGTPVDCGGTVGARTAQRPYAPEEDLARNCATGSGDLLRHVSTANTARDMDQVRKALGERRIHYWGASYGTYLGGVYATLFPRSLDKLVLDSSIHPDWAWRRSRFGQAEAKELRTQDMFGWIAERNATAGLGATAKEVTATWDRLRLKLKDAPIAHPQRPGVFATDRTLFNATGFYVNYRATWQLVEAVLVELNRSGTADALFKATEQFGQELPGGGGEHRPVNMISAFLAVTCGEDAWPRDVAVYERDAATLAKRFPTYGREFMLGDLACAFWPNQPSPQVRIAERGLATPPLVIQSRRDPATPYVGGVAMAERLHGRLLSVAGGEHGPSASGNPCSVAAVNAYFQTGALPAPGTECAETPPKTGQPKAPVVR
ncbi:alpha/beta hydrolase [Allokutzneria albata]|uniref:TAP-like protein n=1 Tax=Allokutzneria albata TaxID=211114 RepID=A0A1G9SSV3_ALLAB|nr:alpha/beta hydrolase [Allokutzneria albata]SDM37935.1 TAP-like protein [Allokutzneria albata]